jgi:hypothetical protein
MNIKSLFHNGFVSIEQKVNEFYFGYVVSKVKGRGASNSFKILEKILSEEYYFQDNVENVFSYDDKVQPHVTNVPFLKLILQVFNSLCERKYGDDFRQVFKRDIIREMAKSSFSTLSTLKASAKKHKASLTIPMELPELKRDIENLIKKHNPFEGVKRPKVVEAISKLVDEYRNDTGSDPIHLFDLVPYCLNQLEINGGFFSDIFPKSQHGGNREIHVLEISARILQYFVELISRVTASKFNSDTITHPETKDTFLNSHYKSASITFGQYVTVCKSADISKWCQRHHVSKFSAMLMNMTDELFHGLIFRVFRLWVLKRISFPLELVSTLLANQNTEVSNKIFDRLRSEFYSGTGVICNPLSNCMRVESGMMQGIWHYSSTECHEIHHEAMRELTCRYSIKVHKLPIIYTIVQGSDDSAAAISIPTDSVKSYKLARCFLKAKEISGEYLSMFYNKPKSSIGTLNLIEYNSEWYLRKQSIKPTFRWVSASLDMCINETYPERMRISYNVLTQALQGGVVTLEASVIQMSQAIMHYKLLGSDNNILFEEYGKMLISNPFPAYGFFPLDPDFIAGIPGFDFQLYSLAKFSNFGNYLSEYDPGILDLIMDYEGRKSGNVSKGLKAVHIGFGQLSLWKNLLKRIDLGDLKTAIEAVEKDPLLIFGRHTTWAQDKYSILLKLFNPGVKASLSNFQPVIRMMVSAAYVLNRPCMSELDDLQTLDDILEEEIPTLDSLGLEFDYLICLGMKSRIRKDFEKKKIRLTDEQKEIVLDLNQESSTMFQKESKQTKVSLFQALTNAIENTTEVTLKAEDIFPLYREYDDILKFLNDIHGKVAIQTSDLSHKTKIDLSVFGNYEADAFPLIDMVKYQWLKVKNIPLSSSQFDEFWQACKNKYKFLRDDLPATQRATGKSVIELKSYIESISTKIRTLHLTDTQAKGGNLKSVISRIYWPDSKLRYGIDEVKILGYEGLRSAVFSLLTFPYSIVKKETLLRKLLTESELLKADFSNIPTNCKRLKIMRDSISGVSRTVLINRISQEKLGVLGFYSERQLRDKITLKFTGNGQWRGNISGTSCVLQLRDEYIEKIIINKLSDVMLLSSGLMRFMRETNKKFENKIGMSKDYLYLTSSGKIVNSKYTVSTQDVIPIEIDQSVEINMFEHMAGYTWRLNIFDKTLRLSLVDPQTERHMPTLLTIINDSFRPIDWEPVITNHWEQEPLLHEWSLGLPMKINSFKSEIMDHIPSKIDAFQAWLRKLKNNNYGMLNGYNLQELGDLILKHSQISEDQEISEVLKQLKEISSLQVEPFNVSTAEVEKTINDMLTIDVESILNKEKSRKALIRDFIEGDDSIDLLDMIENLKEEKFTHASGQNQSDITVSDHQLSRLCKELFSSGEAYEEIRDLDFLTNKGMSVSNRFFEPLESYCLATTTLTLSEVYKQSIGKSPRKLPDVIGKIMSAVTGKFLYSEVSNQDELQNIYSALELEQDTERSISNSDISISKEDKILDCESTLYQLESMLSQASGVLYESLLQLKYKTNRRLLLLKREESILPLEEMPYDQTINIIIDEAIKQLWIRDIRGMAVDERFVIPLLRMELNSHVSLMVEMNEIDNQEAVIFRAAIRAQSISGPLLDAISSFFNLHICCFENTRRIYESADKMSMDKSLILKVTNDKCYYKLVKKIVSDVVEE